MSTDQCLNSAPNQTPSQTDKHTCVCTHRSAIITDTRHNTSQLINIITQTCIGTDSLSLVLKCIQKNPPASVFLSLCVSLYSPHPHPFQSNPGSQGITPRSRSKCHRITSTPLPLLLLSSLHVIPQKYSKRYIQAG